MYSATRLLIAFAEQDSGKLTKLVFSSADEEPSSKTVHSNSCIPAFGSQDY